MIEIHEDKPDSAPTIFDLQAKDFIDSLEDDFYVQLIRYQGYGNRPFHTKDLSILILLSIAECYLMDMNNKASISTPIHVEGIMNVVMSRLGKAPKYGPKATKYLQDLLCGSSGKAFPPDGDIMVGTLEEGEELDEAESGLTIDPNARISRFL